jgi:hypothetical protein
MTDNSNIMSLEITQQQRIPSAAFADSDQKKRALTGRHNFVMSILSRFWKDFCTTFIRK